MPSITRRELLRLGSAGLGCSLAGCLSGSSDPRNTSSPTATPVGDGSASGPQSCPEGFTAYDPWWIVTGSGPLGGFDLTLEERETPLGGSLVAHVRNVTDEERQTGNKAKYDIQRQADDQWQSIYGMKGKNVGFQDDAASHPPGEGFDFDLTFTKEGLSNATDHHPVTQVCSPLEPGTYRFVYWGITTERERQENFETDYALGRTFTVVKD